MSVGATKIRERLSPIELTVRGIIVDVNVIGLVERRLSTAAKERLELIHAQRLALEDIRCQGLITQRGGHFYRGEAQAGSSFQLIFGNFWVWSFLKDKVRIQVEDDGSVRF